MAEPIRNRPEEPREIPVTPRREPVTEYHEDHVMGHEPYYQPMGAFHAVDLVRWGPIVAGLVTTFATFLVLGLLGTAIGFAAVDVGATTGRFNQALTASAIWAAVSLILGFFLGGWVAARTAGITGEFVSMINGAMVWAAWLTVFLFVAAIGATGLLEVPGLFVTGVTRPTPSPFVGPTFDPGAFAAATRTLWWTVLALLVGLAASVLGGYVGRHPAPEPEEYYTGMRHED